MQTQARCGLCRSADQKPHRRSRRLRLMVCRFGAQFLGIEAAADDAPLPCQASRGQFTAPSQELHVANRDLGTVRPAMFTATVSIRPQPD